MHACADFVVSARISVWPGKGIAGRVQRFLVNAARWRWHSPHRPARHRLPPSHTDMPLDHRPPRLAPEGWNRRQSPAGHWMRLRSGSGQPSCRATRSSTPASPKMMGWHTARTRLVGEKLQAQLGSHPRGVAHRDRDTRQTHAIILRGLRQWHGQLGRPSLCILELAAAKTCKNEREMCKGTRRNGYVPERQDWKGLLGLMLLVSGD